MQPRSAAFPSKSTKEDLPARAGPCASAKLDGCLMVAPENIYYAGGYETWVGVNSPQFMIFTAKEDAPTLILRNVDLALARETTWISDIRTYHLHTDSVADLVRKVLKEKGLASGTLGIEFQSYALPHAMALTLKEALPGFAFTDCTELFGDLRLVKSPAEIDMLRAAGAFAQIGLEAAARTLKAGMTEIAFAAEIEGAMRRAGSDYWAIPTELASGWRSAGGHAAPRAKIIEDGDLVHVEFAGVSNRYHATALQTLAVGKPPARAQASFTTLPSSRCAPALPRPSPARRSMRSRKPRSNPCARRASNMRR